MQRSHRTMLAVLGLGLAATGCASTQREAIWWNQRYISQTTNTDTMTQTMSESIHRYDRIADQDARALLDDIDLALRRQRPTRLTRWHTR